MAKDVIHHSELTNLADRTLCLEMVPLVRGSLRQLFGLAFPSKPVHIFRADME